MSIARFLDYNFIWDETVTLTASSSDSEFPSTNLRNHHLSKVWRTAGCFEITSSNRYFDFYDGASKTVTIDAGNYTGAELATAIENGLNSTAAATDHTVTFEDGLFTIATPTGITLEFATGANTANTIASTIGFQAINTASNTEHIGGYQRIHTSEWVEVDLRTITEIDSVAIIFNPSSSIVFSGAATIKVQANSSNNWSAPAVDVTLSIDETYGVATHFFSGDQSYRYWRFYFKEIDNPNGYLEIPKLFLSKASQIQNPDIGFSHVISDESKSSRTSYGQKFSDIYPSSRSFSLNYTALTAAEMETLYNISQRVGTVTPIAFCLDPDGTDFDKDRFFLYGYLDGKVPQDHSFLTYFNTGISIQEAF